MMAPHTSSLAFSFLACACALLELLRTRQILLFLFWRVPVPCWGWLRTRQILLFLFWRVPVPYWGCSAHAKSCFFFFGVCLCPVGVGSAHAKSCLFFSGVCLCPIGVAPHTPSLAFSFLACTCALLGLLRTRQILLFLLRASTTICWFLSIPLNISFLC